MMFEKQGQHYFLLIVLLLGITFLGSGEVLSGQLWGIGTQTWLWIAVATPVLHQIVVALLWRAELYHHKMTDWFGDRAFFIFKFIFTLLFVGRPVTLILLGISNANTLDLSPVIACLMNSRLASIIRKEFIHILRDPRIRFDRFVIPIMQLFLLGIRGDQRCTQRPSCGVGPEP
jgi:hypothetical protein